MLLKGRFVYQQFFCVIPICTLFFMIGVARSWLAPILHQANDPHSELPLTVEQSSWIASLTSLSQAFSPIIYFFLLDRMGRKQVVILNALISVGVWITVYWSRDVFVHYILRILSGNFISMHFVVSSIYVCENSSSEFRGTFSTMMILFRYAGQSTVHALATFCDYSSAALVYVVFALIALSSTLLLVETPQFLLMKGRTEEARANFARLRDMKDANVVAEFEAMKANIEQEKRPTFCWATYRSKEVYRGLRIVLILMSLFMANGWVVVNTFMTKLLAFGSSNSRSANELSLYCSLFHLVSAATSSLIIDRVNRRTLIIFGSAATCASLAGIVLLYHTHDDIHQQSPSFQISFFVIFTVFSCLETGLMFPLVVVLAGELLPQRVKRVGAALNTFTSSLVFFVESLMFLPVERRFGTEMNFVIYTAFAFLMTVYAYYDVPETRGRTLVQIQNELKGAVDEEQKGCE